MRTVIAYIDPGSGSFIFQVLVGSAMAAGLGVKVFWRRFTGLFKRSEGAGTPGRHAGDRS